MITVQSTFFRHKVLLTIATIFAMMLVWAGGASAQWPEEDIGEDFWYDILKISEEAPSFELELGGPTAIKLPFVEEPTEVRWMTKDDVTVYVFTDHWRLQRPHGAITYEGEAFVAFLPSPTTGGFAYIGTETFNVPCGGIQARLHDDGEVTTDGTSTSKALAIASAETLAERNASTDANNAVTGYEGCPATCRKAVRWVGWNNVSNTSASFNFWRLPDSRYWGMAEYEWSAYVICQ